MMAAEVAEGADSGPEEGKSSLKRPPERRREAAMKKRASSRGRPEEERAQSQVCRA
jgi:hypothetical protein